MYRKQLVTHVTAKLQAGISNEEIQKGLTNDGWTVEDIKDAFYYSQFPEKNGRFSIKRMLRSEVPATITLFLLVLTTVIIGSFSLVFANKTLNYTINIPQTPPADKIAFAYGAQEALSDPDYFAKVKEQFVESKASFIEADLSAMTLSVYKDGELSIQVPINSKGREGSWWETPAGLYKIISKDKARFSGMGHVWMPWAMNFQGNFFIHGRTYYPDGSLTSAQFTGGCIRLGTDDAQRVYEAVAIGTPVLVFKKNFSSDNFTYNNAVPSISAPIYMAADLHNNYVFTSKESTTQVPIASITKLMTALVTTEYINLDKTATVPKEAIVYTSKPRLKIGDQYTVYQLLFPLLMESSNEAAETIARYYGYKDFIRYMNEKAVAIGMTHTHFADPSGASAENVSTAEDLFMLAKYIYNNRSFIFHITSGQIKDSAYGTSGFADIGNFNDFVNDPYFYGGKNGKTGAAIETNISVFEFPVGETKRPIVTIILKSPDEKKDSQALIDSVLNDIR